MPEPITMTAVGTYYAVKAAHKAFHHAHPVLCSTMHKLVGRGIGNVAKSAIREMKK